MQGLIFGFFVCLCWWTSAHALTDAQRAQLRDQVLNATNAVRQAHCAPPVQRNATLEQEAQAYCEQMAHSGAFAHSNRTDEGENSYQHTPFDLTKQGGEVPVNYWAAESGNYTSHGAKAALHFTQLVWKLSTGLGVGVVELPNNGIMFVVRYYPRGNYEGQFTKNVAC